MPRPRSHYRTGKLSHELRADAPVLHTGKPDAIKMARAVEDALTGILWNDDAQICAETIEKIYGSKPGCKLTLVELE
jgi:crossover junction endodeoxyribonuclease RusA